MEQWKIFRNYRDGIGFITLVPYESSISYSTFIRESRESGLRQVIINSELMIEILVSVLSLENTVILEIELSDVNETELQDEINSLANKIKTNPKRIGELVKTLAWASEDNSIDIQKLNFGYINKINNKYESAYIICNGILSGDDPHYFYNNYVRNLIQGYFKI